MLHRRFHFAKSFGTMAILAIACTLSPNARAETVVRKESGTKVPMISRATMDAMKRSVAVRFILPGNLKDAGSVKLQFRVKLGKDGNILGTPEADASGGSEATRKTIRDAAFRAIVRAAPFTMLPKDKYDGWKEVIFNFDASDLNP
ncbi:hypothetical protein [Rhizobium sp. BK377]|jgi:hypothetical protein|uniref:hypothetical protein n=1 Tax=Rhizobium sp. BK377 TaxID=2587058 RepID=UPI00160EC15F|nr:hypothetical protein [Rhizobium sp. BK377]MBB3464153.1 hypothetical protein [Rhizobium sp. BK377]